MTSFGPPSARAHSGKPISRAPAAGGLWLGPDVAGDSKRTRRGRGTSADSESQKRGDTSPSNGDVQQPGALRRHPRSLRDAESRRDITHQNGWLPERDSAAMARDTRQRLTAATGITKPESPIESSSMYARRIYERLEQDGVQPPSWPSDAGSPRNKAVLAKFKEAYKLCRERARTSLITAGLIDNPDDRKKLEDAIEFKGICDDMCPDFEKITRISELDIKQAEKDPRTGWPSLDRMVKKLARSAAGQEAPLPMDVRSIAALRKTLDYLVDDLLRNDDKLPSLHGFLWDRTRAIRRDFAFYSNFTAEELFDQVYCLENITRFHITSLHLLSRKGDAPDDYSEHQEIEQLGNSFLSLKYAYDDCRSQGISCPNEAEFRAYELLLRANQPNILETVQREWDSSYWQESDDVRRAVSLVEALHSGQSFLGPLTRAPSLATESSPNTYLRILEDSDVTYTMACFAEIHFGQLRRSMLQVIVKAYSRPRDSARDITGAVLNEFLAFDEVEQACEFAEQHGLRFESDPDHPLDQDRRYLVLDYGSRLAQPKLTHQFSFRFVESKRGAHSLSTVIHQTVKTSDDDDSLFVPQAVTENFAGPRASRNSFSPTSSTSITTDLPDSLAKNPFLRWLNVDVQAASASAKPNNPFALQQFPLVLPPLPTGLQSSPGASTLNPFGVSTPGSLVSNPSISPHSAVGMQLGTAGPSMTHPSFAAQSNGSTFPTGTAMTSNSTLFTSMRPAQVEAFSAVTLSRTCGLPNVAPMLTSIPAVTAVGSRDSPWQAKNATGGFMNAPLAKSSVSPFSSLAAPIGSSFTGQEINTTPQTLQPVRSTSQRLNIVNPSSVQFQSDFAANSSHLKPPPNPPNAPPNPPSFSHGQPEPCFPAAPIAQILTSTEVPYEELTRLIPATSTAAAVKNPPATKISRKDFLDSFTSWIVEGDRGILEDFEIFAVEKLVKGVFKDFKRAEAEQKRRDEEVRLERLCRDFRERRLRLKYFDIWRIRARESSLRRRCRSGRDAVKAFYATKVQPSVINNGPHSTTPDVAAELQAIVHRRRESAQAAEDALYASGILSGIQDERGAISKIVRQDYTHFAKASNNNGSLPSRELEDRSRLGRSTDTLSVSGRTKTQSLRKQFGISTFRRTLPPLSSHDGVTPADKAAANHNSRLPVRWRLKAMGIVTTPDGKVLPEILAGNFGQHQNGGSASLSGLLHHKHRRRSDIPTTLDTPMSPPMARSSRSLNGRSHLTAARGPVVPAGSPTKRKRPLDQAESEIEVIPDGTASGTAGVGASPQGPGRSKRQHFTDDTSRLLNDLRAMRAEMEEGKSWFHEQNERMRVQFSSNPMSP